MEYFRHIALDYLKELYKELESCHIKVLKTIYIGGGTPTALEDDLFEDLLKHIFPYVNSVKEYTVEANIENLTKTKLNLMKKYGVTRLSLGVESTDDEILKSINRHHTYKDIQEVVPLARECGFDNINVDLIMGLPHSTMRNLKEDVDRLLALDVEHISTYSLIIEKNTVLSNVKIEEKSDEEERAEYDLVDCILKEHGFHHYEVSNFAKEGKESLHNLTYWKDEEYYGIGLGASSYINGKRMTNTRSITEYLKGKRAVYEEEVSPIDDEEYFIILNLRTSYGIDDEIFKKRFGHSFIEKYKNKIAQFISNRSLILMDNIVFPTYEGMMILDFILLKILD